MVDLKIFSGRSNEPLAREIVRCLQESKYRNKCEIPKSLGDVFIKDHPDGEVYVRYGEGVRGCNVFLVQSTNQPDKNLEELRQMVQAAKQARADSITVVFPYFGYGRQDRRDRPRAAVAAVGVVKDLFGRGATGFVLLDPHSNAIEAALAWEPIPVDRLWARMTFVPYLKSNFPYNHDNLAVASPDLGSVSLANMYAELLEEYPGQIPVVVVVKRRKPGESETNVLFVVGKEVIENSPGIDVLIVDDMIDGGSTLLKAVSELKKLGAGKIYAVSTHGVFSGESLSKIAKSPIEKIFITDSIRHKGNNYIFQNGLAACSDMLVYVSVAPLLAEAIFRIHTNQSVSSLFK